jgi:hypothetical protein
VKAEDLYTALNATSLALRLAASAAKPFEEDINELETVSETAASVAYIKNHLSDAQKSLADAEGEIGRLIHQSRSV